jgi:hypothetical protein
MHRRTLLAAPLLLAATPAPTRLRIAFATHAFTATLNDTQAARDLAALLPLALTIADYSTNEKIIHLPRKLSEEGAAPFANEAPGDLCYYAPWGNLALFHAPYRWSRGLLRLGRLDAGPEPLLTRGQFPVTIERLA